MEFSPVTDISSTEADRQQWIVERYAPLLLSQASYRIPRALKRHVDPGDVVNDVWISVLPRIDVLELRGRTLDEVLMRYLSTSLVNRVNELSRRHALGARAGDLTRSPAEEEILAQISQNTSGVLTKVHRSAEAVRLHDTLKSLPETDYEIVCLRGIEQRSAVEVAQLTGHSVNTVSQRYRRAMVKLRNRLPNSWLGFPIDDPGPESGSTPE